MKTDAEVQGMEIFRIMGGVPLKGAVQIGPAKNAALPILAATLLTDEPVTVVDCPYIADVHNMLDILRTLGCEVEWRERSAVVRSASVTGWEMPGTLSKLIRSSIFMMGSILGRFRKAVVTYPGGCEIGQRPIDLHLKGLRALGVTIREEHGMVYCDGSRMQGGEVHLDFPSVGATENVMMAAVLIPGRTVIHNAAREPEIEDLQNMINAMGGRVSGAGTQVLCIEGVRKLSGVCYRPIPDRIVAGTMMCAAAVTGGEVLLTQTRPGDMIAVIDKMRQAGCAVDVSGDQIGISARRLKAFRLSTQPHPGFPTDMQAQMMSMACVARGTSVIVENVFESRFAHATQLRYMGADVLVDGRTAVVRGGKLTGARVTARDLRGGAALVLAGLAAQGITEVENVSLVDRGYCELDRMLACLGAKIQRL